MSKITYILGAGASYGKRGSDITIFLDGTEGERLIAGNGECSTILEGLPIVTEIPQRLGYIISKLKAISLPTDSSFRGDAGREKKSQQGHLDLLIEDLEWLKENSSKHATIDTFAKKLAISGIYEDRVKLKVSLSVYLLLEQMLNKPDSRYDTLFASILEERGAKLPEKVSFMSWNYDSQFELTYSQYLTDSWDVDSVKEFPWYYEKRPHFSFNKEQSKFIKINGTTSLLNTDGNNSFGFVKSLPEFNTISVAEMVNTVTTFYGSQTKHLKPLMSFAWEDSENGEEYKKALVSNNDTEVLVVIGYSFPFFNRNIDKTILQSMKNLRKVYIQDPNANNIIRRFKEIYANKVDVEPITDIEQFYIPYEL